MQLDYAGNSRWPDALRGMRQIQEEMNRWLGTLSLGTNEEFPPVNVWTGADGAIVAAELPGVSPDKIDITVHGDTVSLRGKREPEDVGDKAAVLRQERPYGDFGRAVVLPFRIDPDNVEARSERGVVILNLPRPASDRPRHITVTQAS